MSNGQRYPVSGMHGLVRTNLCLRNIGPVGHHPRGLSMHGYAARPTIKEKSGANARAYLAPRETIEDASLVSMLIPTEWCMC